MIGREWTVGMEVVFIGAPRESEVVGNESALNIGDVYTITELHAVNRGSKLLIATGEIVEMDYDALYIRVGTLIWYLSDGFRPVQKRTTDISMFTAMLTGNREPVDA